MRPSEWLGDVEPLAPSQSFAVLTVIDCLTSSLFAKSLTFFSSFNFSQFSDLCLVFKSLLSQSDVNSEGHGSGSSRSFTTTATSERRGGRRLWTVGWNHAKAGMVDSCYPSKLQKRYGFQYILNFFLDYIFTTAHSFFFLLLCWFCKGYKCLFRWVVPGMFGMQPRPCWEKQLHL